MVERVVTTGSLPDSSPEPPATPPWRDERPLFERAEELAALDRALAATRGDGGRLVVIEGPPGIGKTSLLAEARTRATALGLTVLHARGSEFESTFSFGVIRQLFEPVVAGAGSDRHETFLHGAASHAGRLFRADVEVGQANEDEAFSLLHGLYWLTLNLAESRPLAIAIDDLQWADAPSLRWLAYLVRRIEGQGVSVVATLRPVEEEDPLLAELLLDPAIVVLRPKALSAPSVAELVRAELGAEADDAFSLACHRMSGGNPLLLRELLRALAAEEIPPVAASSAIVERVAPDAVARSVRLRLSHLSPEASRLARAIAVLGDGTSRDYAAALAELDPRQVRAAAASLARIDLFRVQAPLAFAHPVVRNAVYEDIPPAEREAAHTRAAEILKAANAPAAQVAAHVLRVAPGSVDGATAILREAARQAASEGGPESASSYLRRGLDERLGGDDRGELLLDLAAVELDLGSTSVVNHLEETVGLLKHPARVTEARLQLGRALYWAGREEAGVRVLEDALAEWRSGDDLRRRLQAEFLSNATRLAGRFGDARRLLESLEVSPHEGPGARLLLALQAYHEAAAGGNRDRALERTRLAFESMSDEERRWSFVGPLYTLLVCDDLDEPVRILDSLIARARKDGAVFRFAGLSIMRAAFHFARGTLIEAEADARTAFDAMPHRKVSWAPHAYGWLAQILVERGSVAEAAAITEDADRAIPVTADSYARGPLLRARATVAAARGDHRAALAAALALGETLALHGSANPAYSYPSWRTLAAQAQLALGEAEDARRLAHEEVALAREWGAPRTLGRALRILGVVEGGEQGLEHAREAVEVLENSPAKLEHAYALADLGAALRRANRRADAREPLRQALELAQQNGATLLGERAHAELVIAGGRPRRLALTGVDALTPSERRIAAMAADGLSNREIAQALFVTLRTVEMHLSNAFRKLDISTRTQLPEALAGSREAPVGRFAG